MKNKKELGILNNKIIDECYNNIECIDYIFNLHTLTFNNLVVLPSKLLIDA